LVAGQANQLEKIPAKRLPVMQDSVTAILILERYLNILDIGTYRWSGFSREERS